MIHKNAEGHVVWYVLFCLWEDYTVIGTASNFRISFTKTFDSAIPLMLAITAWTDKKTDPFTFLYTDPFFIQFAQSMLRPCSICAWSLVLLHSPHRRFILILCDNCFLENVYWKTRAVTLGLIHRDDMWVEAAFIYSLFFIPPQSWSEIRFL